MLVCGQVNPPPLGPGYNGTYWGVNDDMEGKAKALRGIPLRVEHNSNVKVGEVISGWTDKSGAMWALAEINTGYLPGAVTAAAVEKGRFKEFSLGYKSQLYVDEPSGKLMVGNKNILELSIVKNGAREGCQIAFKER